MPDLDTLNKLPDDALRAELTRCCGSTNWVTLMLRERPFRDREHLHDAAVRIWWSLSREDWLEAFSHHPRIGERASNAATAAWSSGEQAGATRAADDVKAQLVEGNRAYEARYGHVYLVCATGKSAEEMLAILKSRMGNDPEGELRVAAGEHEKITRIRLEKLLAS